MKTLLQISLFLFLLTQIHYSQWVQVGPPGLTIISLASSGSIVYAGTLGQGLYCSTNDGQSWEQTPLNTGVITALAFIGPNIVAGTESSGLYLSTNNGQTWTQILEDLAHCLVVNGSDIFCGMGYGGGVYLSIDNGQTWTQTAFNNQSVFSLSVSGSNIFAGTYTGVYRSTDYGQTWTEALLDSSGIQSITSIGSNVIAGTWENGLFYSTDDGETWSHSTALYEIKTLLALGSNVFAGFNGVWKSTNYGQTWTGTGLPAGPVLDIEVSDEYLYAGIGLQLSVWRKPLNQLVPVELTSFTASIVNSDIVLNWTTASEINNQGFEIERSFDNQIFFTIGFIPGYGSTTETKSYSFTITGAPTGIQYYRLKQIDFDGSFEYSDIVEVENNIPDKFTLSQNFPNPFNPSTTISFSLPVEANVNIKLFNMLGQEVAQIVSGNFQASNHNLEFNANNLSSGTYFYLLEARGNNGEHFNSTKKMILMK